MTGCCSQPVKGLLMWNILKQWYAEWSTVPTITLNPVTVYVIGQDSVVPPHRIIDLMLYLNHLQPLHIHTSLPDYPCITERQYHSLPTHLQMYFESRLFQPHWKSP
jgi:hypothetical protein